MIIPEVKKFLKQSILFEEDAKNIFGIQPIKSKDSKRIRNLINVAIITSTKDEFEAISKKIDNLIELPNEDDDSLIYYSGEILNGSNRIKVILPYPISMGIEAAVSVTTKILTYYSPEYIFMVGVCAGNKNNTKIGDIVIAEKSINYNEIVDVEKEGKEIKKKYMQSSESIKKQLKSRLSVLTTEKVLSDIKLSYKSSEKIENEITCHFGLMVTGSSLLRSSQKIDDLNKSYHNIRGMDMETHGFYFASNNTYNDKRPYFVSIKSVSDFGDDTKHKLTANERKKFALHISSEALIYFLNNIIK